MDPRNPLFYAGAFVAETSAHPADPAAQLATAAQSMFQACYSPDGRPDMARCALTSRTYGRLRVQSAAAVVSAAAPPPTAQQQQQQLLSVPSGVSPASTAYGALVALGSLPQ